jgi:hypothetical protein
MKLSYIVCASIVTLAAVALTADGAFAAVNYNASKSNTGNSSMSGPTSCPAGQSWSAATRKCAMPMATPLNNRQNVSRAAQPPPTSAPTATTNVIKQNDATSTPPK